MVRGNLSTIQAPRVAPGDLVFFSPLSRSGIPYRPATELRVFIAMKAQKAEEFGDGPD